MSAATKLEAVEKPKSLVTKLAEVMALVVRVPKSGHNKFHNYDYATEADLVESVRGLMAERKVMLFLAVKTVDSKTVPTKSGEAQLVTMLVDYEFHDGETGEVIKGTSAGQGSDALDKGVYKSLTGALKYIVRQTFLIPTGDDPEASEAHPDPEPARAARPQESRPQQTADVLIPFGKDKGKRLRDSTGDNLRWVYKALGKSVTDPDKANFKRQNEELMRLIWAELESRKNGEDDSDAKSAAIDEDAPF